MNYEKLLNPTLLSTAPSGIRRFFDLAAALDDVIALTIGEPDFSTPERIRKVGIETLEKGRTWYSPNAGFIELRQAIADYLARRFAVSYDPASEVIVTVGGSEAIDLTMRALVSAGDEVLVPDPSFVCYQPLVRLAGGTSITLETKAEDDFRLTAAALKAAITPKTKLLVLPFPNNPTGAVMRREHLEEIAEVLRDTDILVLADEIYAELTYGDSEHVSLASLDGMKERTILVSGFSKAYAMTGWRLGYCCGPQPIIQQMLKLHQYGIMSSPTTAQYAAIEALKNADEDVAAMRAEYDRRRRLIVDGLREIGMPCFEPEGAFYVFPSVQMTGLTSEEFCRRLLEEKRVAVVPGTAFGECGEGFVRISYCYSVDHIREALRRMDEFLEEFR
ncbi:MAG: aminotransferase class I/II-fold pyridoxal phosphate-dependent enzyme [Clostridia bacterium]|nr:aminotransferase class I/II-fold pyridoxal phosphate-dependent enzyme [Clostridia bacterium]